MLLLEQILVPTSVYSAPELPPWWMLLLALLLWAVIINVALTLMIMAIYHYRYHKEVSFWKLYFRCYLGAFALSVFLFF